MNLDPEYYVQGVIQGDRVALSRAITLIESSHVDHRKCGEKVIERLLPHSGRGIRIGITGVPGVGKSTFIDSFGSFLTDRNNRTAVLAIDPSSRRSGGSILGDKTRMQRLSTDRRAFIRPSPSSGTLGGVARKTRETILICEAAGFDVIIVETVGVGQSETAVASMVDFFLVLMLGGAGDELQGIKKGILELADALVINKADGAGLVQAEKAAKTYKNALHLLAPVSKNWSVPVLTCSSLEQKGIEKIWETINHHRSLTIESGEFETKRQKQSLDWLSSLIEDELQSLFYNHPQIKKRLPDLLNAVEKKSISPTSAAAKLLALFAHGP